MTSQRTPSRRSLYELAGAPGVRRRRDVRGRHGRLTRFVQNVVPFVLHDAFTVDDDDQICSKRAGSL
jgi:hypothetical protein